VKARSPIGGERFIDVDADELFRHLRARALEDATPLPSSRCWSGDEIVEGQVNYRCWADNAMQSTVGSENSVDQTPNIEIASVQRKLKVNIMTTVKCPICKERVSGASSADLNMNLKEHLADVHRMSELVMGPSAGTSGYAPSTMRTTSTERPMEREYVREQPRRNVSIENRPAAGLFSAPESRTEREVETWTSRRPERYRSEYYIPREEVRQWRYPVTGAGGERGPSRAETTMPAMINCPLCGDLVRGRDEDDLSDRLHNHMADTHDIRPKMYARYRT
jgi:predicted small metal-binding protein